eukprot:gene16200-22363_t
MAEAEMASAIEVDAIQEIVPPPQFTLHLLLLIRTAQAQNGIKHGEFSRYRRHCTNRLQALYKALKFQHGRTKYQKKKLDPDNINDSRQVLSQILE